jgi:uncharacterized membrane protein
MVKHTGIMRFERADNGASTRLDIHASYNPGIGYVGHGVAALMGLDPKHALDDALVRIKARLEAESLTPPPRTSVSAEEPLA